MYNNIYQEYINSIVGTNPNYNRMETTNFENTINTYQFFQNSVNNENLERFYPELYRLLYPMIQHVCMKNMTQLSENTINDMVEEVYLNFVSDSNNEDSNSSNEFRSGKSLEKSVVLKSKSSTATTTKKEERREYRQENYILRDLIRILILRELLGGTGENRLRWSQTPFRPPFGPRDSSIYETSPIIY